MNCILGFYFTAFYLVHLLVNVLNYYDIEHNKSLNICVKCHLYEGAMLKDVLFS